MGDAALPSTSLTLLERLRQQPQDQAAWDDFVASYGRTLYSWCRAWGLQEADAQDVTQNVLLQLARQMQSFVYQPGGSFRAWLKTVAYRAWCDFLASRKRAATGTGDTGVLQLLESATAREDLLEQLGEQFDRELLEEAMSRVRQRVQPHTWEAFRLTALEEQSGAVVAEQLHMKIGAVYVARSKVQRMLQHEIERLEQDHSHLSNSKGTADGPLPDARSAR